MFNRKSLFAALALTLAAASGAATAQSREVDPDNGVYRLPYIPAWMKAMTITPRMMPGLPLFQTMPISGDGLYRFVGGEGGWELLPTMYEFNSQGKMVRMQAMRMPGSASDFNEAYGMQDPSRGS